MSTQAEGPSILELQLREIQNAVKHLKRSTEELHAHIMELKEWNPNTNVQVFVDAILENQEALAIKEEKIRQLEILIEKAHGSDSYAADEKTSTTDEKKEKKKEKQNEQEREAGITL